MIRHRACTLRDTAYAYIKAEMDTDFEYKCRDIRDNRAKRARSPTNLAPDFVYVEPATNVSIIGVYYLHWVIQSSWRLKIFCFESCLYIYLCLSGCVCQSAWSI